MTESTFIEELKKGNTSVFKEVYIHLDVVTSFVVKNSGTTEDGHDTFQEALIVFYRNVVKPDFKLTSSIKTYIYSIARRLWLKKLRDSKSMFVNHDDDLANEAMVEEFEFELSGRTVDKTAQVLKVLDNLSEACRNILKMFYFNRLSLDEIGERLGYSSSHVVRQQKYRCLKTIRDKM